MLPCLPYVLVVRAFLVFAALWVVSSLGISIIRLFALKLEDSTTIIEWFLADNNTDGNPFTV